MIRRSLSCDWTEDDRLTRAKWMRGVGIFYGCIALVVLAVIAFSNPSRFTPNAATEHQTWRGDLSGERVIAMPTCPGKRTYGGRKSDEQARLPQPGSGAPPSQQRLGSPSSRLDAPA